MNRKIKFGVFIALLSAVLVTCGVMIGGELLARQKEKEDFEELAKLVTVKKPSTSPAPSAYLPASTRQVIRKFQKKHLPRMSLYWPATSRNCSP